jgi:hypothetical protein
MFSKPSAYKSVNSSQMQFYHHHNINPNPNINPQPQPPTQLQYLPSEFKSKVIKT